MKSLTELLFFPLSISLLSLVIFNFVRVLTLRFLSHLVDRSGFKVGQVVLLSLKTPSFYWCLAIALSIGIGTSDLPTKYGAYITKFIEIILILSITVAVANLIGALLKNYIQRLNLPIPTTGLAFGIIKGSILAIGILISLSALGISITPLITALGIGGLAVSLALRDTLSNLFAGMQLLLEKSIRLGDFIRLESGQEGRVEDITWMTTRIRMLSDNMVIIPNNKLSQSMVINFSLPEQKMSLQVPVSVSYEADPDRVEAILNDEARKAVGQVEGLLADPAPAARLIPGFGAGSLDFTLNCQVADAVSQYQVLHELRKRILKRLKEEGIEIPLPPRMIHLREDQKKPS